MQWQYKAKLIFHPFNSSFMILIILITALAMPIFLMMADSQEWKEARRSYKVKSEYLKQIKQLRKVLRQERNI
jgi:hypothetical protein